MADSLLEYYERELTFLRRSGAEFGKRYDKIAQRLLLEPDKCDDPHVERLLEGTAFLAARVHRRLDEEFPELAEAMLANLFPQLLAPIPPISIVQMAGKEHPTTVPALTPLLTPLVPGYDAPCRFRTAYPVRLLPIAVRRASFALPGDVGLSDDGTAQVVLVLELESLQIPFSGLGLGPDDPAQTFYHGEIPLRFYLSGPQQFLLYDVLLDYTFANHRHQVQVRPAGEKGPGVPIELRPVGFHSDELLLPGSVQALVGYRILQEYFAFPKKYLFFDLLGFSGAVCRNLGNRMEVLFCLQREPPRQMVLSADDFRLGCTPIVNLFAHRCDEIHLDQTRVEYTVIPDVRRRSSIEVFSIDKVAGSAPDGSEPVQVQPFYGLKYGSTASDQSLFFAARRREGRDGSDVYLSLVDLAFDPARPPWTRLYTWATCTNRSLAAKLPLGGSQRPTGGSRDMHPQGVAAEAISALYCLERPTPSLRPQLGKGSLWRLISHLCLNHLSIENPAALRELLKIYSFVNPELVQNEVAGIQGLSVQRTVARARDGMPGFCRGLELRLQLDDDCYVGRSAFLFASVLERFFAEYVSINSFTQLVLYSGEQRVSRRWPPRAGDQVLL